MTPASVQPAKRRSPAVARRRQEERSADTRERLIAAAVECIERVGYAEATTTLIANHARVSRGALQHHFASKTDLMVAVIDRVATELNFRFAIDALVHESIERRIEAVVERYWSVFMGPYFRASLNIALSLTNEPVLSARLERRLDDVRAGIVSVWHELFCDVGCSDAELVAALHIVMAAARGFGVLHMLQSENSWDEHRPALCQVAARELKRLIHGSPR